MARQVEFRRRLPQQFALTGMRSRTPIYSQYGSRGAQSVGVPTLGSLSQAPTAPEPKKLMPSVANTSQFSDFGGGPGIGPGEGDAGGFSGNTGVDSNASGLSTAVGNSMAGSMIGRGGKSGLATFGLSQMANAPISVGIPAALQSAVMSALSPVSMVNSIIGKAISGQNALSATQESGLPAEIQDSLAQTAFANSPQSVLGHIGSLIGLGNTASEASQAAIDTGFAAIDPGNVVGGEPSDPGSIGGISAPGIAPGLTGIGGEPEGVGNIGGVSPGIAVGGASGPGGSGGGTGGPGGGGGQGDTGLGMGTVGMGDASGAGGGGGGGTVICTELHRQGLMTDEIYQADVRYGDRLSEEIKIGYYIWAVPLAGLMARSKVVTAIIMRPAMSWARQMAYKEGIVSKPNIVGTLIEKIGVPICRFIGRARSMSFVKSQTNQV